MPVIEETKRGLDAKLEQMGQKNPLPAIAVAGQVAKTGGQTGMAVAREVTPVVAEAGAEMVGFVGEGVKGGLSKMGDWLRGNPHPKFGKIRQVGSTSDYNTGDISLVVEFERFPGRTMTIPGDEDDEVVDDILQRQWNRLTGKKDNPDRYDDYQFPGLEQNPPADKNVPQYINKPTIISDKQMEQNPPSREWVFKFRNGETRKMAVSLPKGEAPGDENFIRHNPGDPLVGMEIVDISPADGKCWRCGGDGCEVCQTPDPVAIANPVPVEVVGKNGTKVENPAINVVNPPQDPYAFVVDPFFRPEVIANPQPKNNPPEPNPPKRGVVSWKKLSLSIKTPQRATRVGEILNASWKNGLTIQQQKNVIRAVKRRLSYIRRNAESFVNANETVKILEGWIANHPLIKENPQVKTMEAEQVVVGQPTAPVDTPPTPTVVVNPPENVNPPSETPKEPEKTVEPKAEDVPKAEEQKTANAPAETKQENPPTPAPVKPVGCQHELKFVGKANPKTGGKTVDVFKCQKCNKTYTKEV